ncbi:hypothetical protein [Streptococcus equinus]|uniref:hypothetical protein n=1 Tax=Streptococcus equinus TaxID=1335 RepID=UPI00114239DF|nr:hypothetical protein [Streptococcus equinus]
MLVNVFLWLVFVLLVVACFVWLDKHEELVEAFLEKISRDLRRCAMFGTCEKKICKPVFDSNVFEVADLAEDYKEIEQVVVNMNDGQGILSSYGEDIDLDRLGLIGEVQDVLMNKLNRIEEQLNIYGYTMQEEPKEVKVHANELKGGNDD